MSSAYISCFDNVDFGGFGRGAQCFDGVTQQDRKDVTASTSWPATPHETVAAGSYYAAVYLTVPGLIYAGPAGADHAADLVLWNARAAAYPAGWWPVSVLAGHVVAIKDL